MKHTKRLVALLWTLCLAAALSAPTLASASAGYSITVLNAQKGEDYKIYKMMDLEVSSDNTAFSYTVSAAWNEFFTTGDGKDYVTLDGEDNHVTWVAGKNTADEMNRFGRSAAAYVTAKSLAPEATITPTGDQDITFDLTASGAGYYLITSTNGTRVYIDTTPTNPNPSISAKNVDPTLEKKVQEGANWGTESYAQVGDTVSFQATIHARRGAKDYVYHDELSGFTLQEGSIAITNGGSTLAQGTDYTVVTSGLSDSCTFEIRFEQTYLDGIADSDIVIAYAATLNDEALVESTGNQNTAHLTWGQASYTADIATTTYTLKASVYKFTMKGTVETALPGAKFTLTRGEEIDAIRFKEVTGAATPTYKIAADQTDTAGTVGEIVTADGGKFILQGLDVGTYYLTESATPTGYNKLAGPVKVVVTAAAGVPTVKYYNYDKDKTGNYDTNSNGIGEIRIENGTGTELPSTGGMGTTVFYVLGGALVVGAVILLVVKSRTRHED